MFYGSSFSRYMKLNAIVCDVLTEEKYFSCINRTLIYGNEWKEMNGNVTSNQVFIWKPTD